MNKKIVIIIICIVFTAVGIYSYISSRGIAVNTDHARQEHSFDEQNITDKDISKIKFEAKGLISKLNQLNSCFAKACDFPDTDPRSYELALNQEIKKNLNILYEKIAEIGFVDPLISKLARHYLKIGDGYVKESALEILSTQPPSEENFKAIDKYIFNYHDPLLITPAANELKKYLPEYSKQITSMLTQVMGQGSLVVKEAIAGNVAPFINTANKKRFEVIRNQYQKGSKIWYSLSQALEQSNTTTQ